jgi:hypothetical protein
VLAEIVEDRRRRFAGGDELVLLPYTQVGLYSGPGVPIAIGKAIEFCDKVL